MTEEIDTLVSALEFMDLALKHEHLPIKVREAIRTARAKVEFVVAKLNVKEEPLICPHCNSTIPKQSGLFCLACGKWWMENEEAEKLCPKCGAEMNPPDTCVGCKWRYQQQVTKCWDCIRTITIDGKHEPRDKDYYEHECGHEKKSGVMKK